MIYSNRMMLILILPAMMLSAMQTVTFRANASDYVRVPCAKYEEGDTWVYKYITDQSTGTEESIVLSNKEDVITIGDKQKSFVEMGPIKQLTERTGRQTLRREGNTLFLVSVQPNVANDERTTIHMPVCGEVPTRSNVVAKIDGKTFSEEKRTVRAVGRERVTVPAGSFEATVIEIKAESQPGAHSAGSRYRIEIVAYIAENVGVVRNVTKNYRPGATESENVFTNVSELQEYSGSR